MIIRSAEPEVKWDKIYMYVGNLYAAPARLLPQTRRSDQQLQCINVQILKQDKRGKLAMKIATVKPGTTP